jgi:hypothetical protein
MKVYAKENTAVLRALRHMPLEQYSHLLSQVARGNNLKSKGN